MVKNQVFYSSDSTWKGLKSSNLFEGLSDFRTIREEKTLLNPSPIYVDNSTCINLHSSSREKSILSQSYLRSLIPSELNNFI